jgi:hypothetical protein
MPGENDPDGLPADGVDNPAATGLQRQQTDRPSRSSIRRRATHHRDQRRLLNAIELGRWLGARVIGQRLLQSNLQVPLPDA